MICNGHMATARQRSRAKTAVNSRSLREIRSMTYKIEVAGQPKGAENRM
jgi:hypothetical protein